MVCASDSPTPAGGPGEGRRLMVVDGADAPRRALAEYFAARGWEVSVARDGEEALARAIRQGVDVVIMSASLPGLEGYEAAAILRRVVPGVRIILTVEPDAEARPHERQWTERFRCFPKPLDLDSIARAVDEERAAPTGQPEGDREGPR